MTIDDLRKARIGLVLGGGGGKGAYEIGVWNTLRNVYGIKIAAVSGTSVGALNARVPRSRTRW
jgi:NTE family protein